MKFTDGNWLVRKGFKLHSPAEVHSVEKDSESLSILLPAGISATGEIHWIAPFDNQAVYLPWPM